MRAVAAGALSGVLLLGIAGGAPAAAEEKGAKDWGYDKGFYFKADQFSMSLGARLQFRLTDTDPEGGAETREFRIRRAKFFASGHAYQPWIRYRVQANVVGQDVVNRVTVDEDEGDGELQDDEVTSSRSRGFDLEDFYVDFARSGLATVRVGQYKVPFGIQELTSSGSQQFVERSLASDSFAPGRDQGVVLLGSDKSKKFGYDVGFFNGNGRNRSANDNDDFEYVARVHFDPSGEYRLEESATGHPEKLLWTVGAGWLLNRTGAAADTDVTSLEGFFALQYKGLSVLADYYTRTTEPPAGSDTDADGYVAQVGYFFVPKKFEVALRASELDPDTDAAGDTVTERRVALNYFVKAHRLKVQVDFGRLTTESVMGDADTDEARAQLQIIF